MINNLIINAQTVSIVSDSTVCLNSVISFSANSNQAISSYSWSFGDGSTSSQAQPANTFNTTGSKTIVLSVTFSNGQTATNSISVMVHDLPKADFDITNANYCFFSRNVCLKDNSTMGSTATNYESRTILWGDGASNQSINPANGDVICYSSFPKVGKYDLVVEVQNDKGCTDKWEKSIEILQDYIPSFQVYIDSISCDSAWVEFMNDSTYSADIASFQWDFKNGITNNTQWDDILSSYAEDTSIAATLRVTLNNGCSGIVSENVIIRLPKPNLNINVDTNKLCYPNEFTFRAPPSFDLYEWIVYNANNDLVEETTPLRTFYFLPNRPGDYKIIAKVSNGSCTQFTDTIFVTSTGVRARFEMLNNFTCNSLDTVFFIDQSEYNSDLSRLKYYWNFEDENAPDCISSNGICNKDTISFAKHIYTKYDCYLPRLTIVDEITGCRDSTRSIVELLKPPTKDDVIIDYSHPCLGQKLGYGITVSIDDEYCGGKFQVNWDSLLNLSNFIPMADNNSLSQNYESTADKNGKVVIGVTYEIGDIRKYSSWDKSDFENMPDRKCMDTFWFPDAIILHPQKEYSAQVQVSECIPVNGQLNLLGDFHEIDSIVLYWNTSEEGAFFKYENREPDWNKSKYDSSGIFNMALFMYDTNGCYNYYEREIEVGWFNDFNVQRVICRGAELDFTSNIYYWNNSSSKPWDDINNDIGGYENVRWDFGDGQGFIGNGPTPKHIYSETGLFTVRMATKNRGDCHDTLSKIIEVGEAVAVIKDMDTLLVCDQIVQLFDSSYSDFAQFGDRVTSFEWDFGAGRAKSFLQNPFHYFNTFGIREVQLKIETNNGCIDSTTIRINVRGPRPEFEILMDSIGCDPLEVDFASNSENVTQFIWRFGDAAGNTLTLFEDDTVTHNYVSPGEYYVFLEGIDSFFNTATQAYTYCTGIYPDTASGEPPKKITVLPIPKVDFDLPEVICKNVPFNVKSTSDIRYDIFNWYVNDSGINQNRESFNYQFPDTGIYIFQLKPKYDPDLRKERFCFDSMERSILVRGIDADFSFEPMSDCGLYQFESDSKGVIAFNWDFGHPTSDFRNFSIEKSPIHNFKPDTGSFEVCLWVESIDGCFDTICQEVFSTFVETANFYNVFTPDGDGLNDEFYFDMQGVGKYKLYIFNRWGERVFSSTEPDVGWNGTDTNGQKMPAGTYFYIVDYTTQCTSKEEQVQGVVTLIR